MEIGLKEGLIIAGIIVIIAIMVDGWRRASKQRSRLKIEIDGSLEFPESDERSSNPELPNGGARVVGQKDGTRQAFVPDVPDLSQDQFGADELDQPRKHADSDDHPDLLDDDFLMGTNHQKDSLFGDDEEHSDDHDLLFDKPKASAAGFDDFAPEPDAYDSPLTDHTPVPTVYGESSASAQDELLEAEEPVPEQASTVVDDNFAPMDEVDAYGDEPLDQDDSPATETPDFDKVESLDDAAIETIRPTNDHPASRESVEHLIAEPEEDSIETVGSLFAETDEVTSSNRPTMVDPFDDNDSEVSYRAEEPSPQVNLADDVVVSNEPLPSLSDLFTEQPPAEPLARSADHEVKDADIESEQSLFEIEEIELAKPDQPIQQAEPDWTPTNQSFDLETSQPLSRAGEGDEQAYVKDEVVLEEDEIPDENVGLVSSRKALSATPDDENVLVLTVLAVEGAPIDGETLLEIVRACDMRFGDMDIFHRFEEGSEQGALQFSMGNLFEPGCFDLKTLRDTDFEGLTLFMSMSEPKDVLNAFECMLATADLIAKYTDAEVADDCKTPLKKQNKQHYRDRIRNYLIQHPGRQRS